MKQDIGTLEDSRKPQILEDEATTVQMYHHFVENERNRTLNSSEQTSSTPVPFHKAELKPIALPQSCSLKVRKTVHRILIVNIYIIYINCIYIVYILIVYILIVYVLIVNIYMFSGPNEIGRFSVALQLRLESVAFTPPENGQQQELRISLIVFGLLASFRFLFELHFSLFFI